LPLFIATTKQIESQNKPQFTTLMIHTICFWNKPTVNNIFFLVGWLVGLFVQPMEIITKETQTWVQTIKLLMQRIHKLLRFSIKGITFIRNLQHFWHAIPRT